MKQLRNQNTATMKMFPLTFSTKIALIISGSNVIFATNAMNQ